MSLERFSPIEDKIKDNKITKRSYRAFHGRGGLYQGVEHICIDVFKNDVLITLFSEENELEKLQELVAISFPKHNIYTQKRYLKEGVTSYRSLHENGHFAHWEDLIFELDFSENQNVGYFLDIENARCFLQEHSRNKKILNLFSYTCALSVIAMKAGASEVVNVDMSKGALLKGKKNHIINNIEMSKVRFLGHDILKSFGKLTKIGPFDGIIVDPPSNQGKSFSLEKDYPKILRRIEAMCAPGAWVMVCANSPFVKVETLKEMVSQNANTLEFRAVMFSGDDFDEQDKTQGLKVLIYKCP